MEEEFASMTAPTSSCEQHMGNTNVARSTQNPELELPLSPRWLEYLINFERMRNKLDLTVPVQGKMSSDCFETPEPYHYTDLTNFLFQAGNFETLGDIQSIAHQGSELINFASANVYYTDFDNDLATNANFSPEYHYLSSPETSDFDGAETLSPSSQESISEVSDAEDGPLKCRWTNCGQGFSNLTELAKHLKDSHVKTIQRNNFVCSWVGCSKRLSSSYKLLAHLRTHSGEKPHDCPISGCNKAFRVAESLKIHIRSHTGEKPCKCRFCDKAYANTSDCRKHERTHMDRKPYACRKNGCNKRYTDPSSLRKHKKQHSANELEIFTARRRG